MKIMRQTHGLCLYEVPLNELNTYPVISAVSRALGDKKLLGDWGAELTYTPEHEGGCLAVNFFRRDDCVPELPMGDVFSMMLYRDRRKGAEVWSAFGCRAYLEAESRQLLLQAVFGHFAGLLSGHTSHNLAHV